MNLLRMQSNNSLAHLIAFYGNLILAGISTDSIFKAAFMALAMWALYLYIKQK